MMPLGSQYGDLDRLPGSLQACGGVAVPGYLCLSVQQLYRQKLDPIRRAVKININKYIRSGKLVGCVLSPPVFATQDSTHGRSEKHPLGLSKSVAPHLQLQLSRTNQIIRASIAIIRNLEAQRGALDLSPAASEDLVIFFSTHFKAAVGYWLVNQTSCQHGSRQRVALQMWAS